jgi:hypothetical protein
MKYSIITILTVLSTCVSLATKVSEKPGLDCIKVFDNSINRISHSEIVLDPVMTSRSKLFNELERVELLNFLKSAVSIYHSEGSFAAYTFLRSSEKLVESNSNYNEYKTVAGMNISSAKVNGSTVTSNEQVVVLNLESFEKTRTNFIGPWYKLLEPDKGGTKQCCSYHPTYKRLQLPLFDIQNYNDFLALKNQGELSEEYIELVDEITLTLFLAHLEEYTHGLQAAFGHPLTGRLKLERFSDDIREYLREAEIGIVLVFQEWGVPLTDKLMSRYNRDNFFDVNDYSYDEREIKHIKKPGSGFFSWFN